MAHSGESNPRSSLFQGRQGAPLTGRRLEIDAPLNGQFVRVFEFGVYGFLQLIQQRLGETFNRGKVPDLVFELPPERLSVLPVWGLEDASDCLVLAVSQDFLDDARGGNRLFATRHVFGTISKRTHDTRFQLLISEDEHLPDFVRGKRKHDIVVGGEVGNDSSHPQVRTAAARLHAWRRFASVQGADSSGSRQRFGSPSPGPNLRGEATDA
jgi:hypothetical protein